MGKHSSNLGGNGRDGDKRQPAKRRTPSRAAGARSLPRDAKPRPKGNPAEEYALSDPRQRRTGSLESAPARLRVERDRRRKRAGRIAAIVAGVVAFLIVAAGLGVFAYAKHIENTMQKTVTKKEKLAVDLAKSKPQQPYTVLIMGFDRRPPETVYRADTMLLARIDPKTKQVWMMSIPRDLRVEIPGVGHRKMNDAYARGREQLAIDTVEKLTGIPVNHFMAVNFTGFQRAVDAMGGVWVDVPTEIDDIKADRSPHHRAAHVDAGYQLLDGEHALTFVRSRDYVDADITRMKNQQIFFKAIADQIATKTSMAKIPHIVSSVAPYISTDMSLVEMLRTAQALKGAGSSNVYTATLPGEWRSPFLWPDDAGIQALVKKFRAGVPFEPKAKPSAGASGTVGAASSSGAVAAAKKPSQVTVTVRNGAGIAGVAKQVSSILKARAFEVVDVGNANQNVYKETLVVYKDDKAAAELVAATLPPGTKLVESRGMYSFDSDILVVVGKDWDLSKVPVTPVQSN